MNPVEPVKKTHIIEPRCLTPQDILSNFPAYLQYFLVAFSRPKQSARRTDFWYGVIPLLNRERESAMVAMSPTWSGRIWRWARIGLAVLDCRLAKSGGGPPQSWTLSRVITTVGAREASRLVRHSSSDGGSAPALSAPYMHLPLGSSSRECGARARFPGRGATS